ncbi:tetratricopeptide repeat protein [Nonomuraea sp. KC401]|uniref:AfsR/SARP family transcriptional regulator n=1 Tax=unclassified Nonomuraea TaxID=2593643 RepID=UPI0010FD3703|nr:MULTISPECIES: BTAD domain-containing putative transcriptional regulator [unclassified Nonomuraea]NBE92625.1 tetratricopeptide repeat protein [Nonomuraea sp. K271]TLF84578.1 tetratricopeptide repeat protein [Nonomuraea sp. KC401]
MTLEIKVLGPFEVTLDGGSLKLAGERRVGLLARLALNAGQPVSSERLLADVWGESTASTAGKQLHIVVSKLRELLSDDIIETVPGGYRLNLAPEHVDAHRFTRLVRQAREAGARHDGATASELFRQALALWRGDALADMTAPWAQIEAARLREERLTAEEDHVDLRLAAGDHHAVAAELAAHVRRHPLRERPRAQLMLALYRDSRPSDALAAYQEGRRVTVDELGVEPGAKLRRLQRAVLTGDPALDLASQGSGPPGVLAELPSDTQVFTARATEVAWLDKAIADAAPGAPAIAAIDGAGGIGKSALAVHAAHAMAHRFTDGVLYVDLNGAAAGRPPLQPIEALGHLLRALGLDGSAVPPELEEAAARYRSLTSNRNLLIILDNARHAHQVRPLIPSGDACAVIVTSRQAMVSLDNAHHLHLTGLDHADAVALLARIADPGRVQAEPQAAEQIARLCDGLPLAVRIAAARLAARPDWTLSYLADRLTDAARRLDALEHADLAVRASIAVSHHHLREEPTGHDAAHLFTFLGLLDLPTLTPGATAALVGWPVLRAEAALDRLLDARILEPAQHGGCRVHDLVRLYAREQAAVDIPVSERAAAVHRTLQHYLATAQAANLLIDPGTDAPTNSYPADRPGADLPTVEAANAWAESERDNLLAAAHQAADTSAAGTAIGLAQAIYWLFWRKGWLTELPGLLEKTLDVAERSGDEVGLAMGHTAIGAVFQEQGHFAASVHHLKESLACWDRTGQFGRKAGSYNDLGITYTMLQKYDDALDALDNGLAMTRASGRRAHEAAVRNNRVHVFYRQGRFEEAIEEGRRVLDLWSELGIPSGEGIGHDTFADACRAAGRLTEAAGRYREAIRIQHETGQYLGEAVSSWWLGQTLYDLGRHDDARESWRRSLNLLRDANLLAAEEVLQLLAQPVPDVPLPIRNQL